MNDKELFNTIAHNIKIERAIKSITQAELAEMVGVHENISVLLKQANKILH